MQGGKDHEDEGDGESIQDRYRVISFDGTEVPLEEAFADSIAAGTLSNVDSNGAEHANGAEHTNGKSDALQQEQEAALAGELG